VREVLVTADVDVHGDVPHAGLDLVEAGEPGGQPAPVPYGTGVLRHQVAHRP
jgi:hypothetical protein